jgi:hypothetical protein
MGASVCVSVCLSCLSVCLCAKRVCVCLFACVCNICTIRRLSRTHRSKCQTSLRRTARTSASSFGTRASFSTRYPTRNTVYTYTYIPHVQCMYIFVCKYIHIYVSYISYIPMRTTAQILNSTLYSDFMCSTGKWGAEFSEFFFFVAAHAPGFRLWSHDLRHDQGQKNGLSEEEETLRRRKWGGGGVRGVKGGVIQAKA